MVIYATFFGITKMTRLQLIIKIKFSYPKTKIQKLLLPLRISPKDQMVGHYTKRMTRNIYQKFKERKKHVMIQNLENGINFTSQKPYQDSKPTKI